LDDRGLIPGRVWEFFLHHGVQTGSGVHLASYLMGTAGSFPAVKRPGREADNSPPSSAEIENAWNYTSTPPYVFTAWYFIKPRDNFYIIMVL
jgi:hypothetical protein